ncbi:MAG: hypothetical protein LBB90_00225 [Tannerella sp.]|jgi:hypothetical protein|nr:hypothetical protein [Tannerella sp.]
MIKTKFTLERSIIGCLISFFIASIIFTGCGKDYDYDIDRLNKKTNTHDSLLNALQTQIAAIQANIANARWITAVNPTSTGYEIHFNTGSPIAINHGSPGTSAQIWQIGSGVVTGTHSDSVWYILYPSGLVQETEYIAIPPRGRDGVDGAPGTPVPVRAPEIVDGYWITYQWNAAKNDFDATHTGYSAGGSLVAYVVDNPNNTNQWLLRVKKGANGDEYQEIILPKNAAGFPGGTGGKITLIGHVSSPDASSLSLSAIDTSVLVVKYWYLDSIYNVAEGVKLDTWQGMKTVRPKQLLTTLPKELSLVLTSDVALSSATSKLKNSKGEALPLATGTPVPYTGLLTKAETVSGGAVYLLPLSIVDSAYATSALVTSGFAGKFVSNAIYYLEDETAGIKSNYSSFSIRPENHSADTNVPTATVTHLGASNGSSLPVNAGVVTSVAINEGYAVGFDPANNRYLYDYNIADRDNTGDIVLYPSLGLFRAMQPGSYSLIVRKLRVDGKIYADTISIVAY